MYFGILEQYELNCLDIDFDILLIIKRFSHLTHVLIYQIIILHLL